jgi:hypothetical protein
VKELELEIEEFTCSKFFKNESYEIHEDILNVHFSESKILTDIVSRIKVMQKSIENSQEILNNLFK